MLTVPGFEAPFSFAKTANIKRKKEEISDDMIIETMSNPVRVSRVTKYPHQVRYHSDALAVVVDGTKIVALFKSA